MRAPVHHWYTYICAENEDVYYPALIETLKFRYHLGKEIKSLHSLKDALRMGRDFSSFAKGRFSHQRPLIKDPFAVFSANWFVHRLDCQVICVVRHPAAFVSSLVRLDWPFELRDLFEQPLLMRDWLDPFRYEIEKLLVEPPDMVAQASLLWKMIYQAVYQLREKIPDFRVVQHEDLSADPIEGYRRLYSTLGLNFTPEVADVVVALSHSGNPEQLSKNSVHSVRLDSRANIKQWKRRLDPEEIAHIRQISEPVASIFYAEQDWY
jgi:hypothetical protein